MYIQTMTTRSNARQKRPWANLLFLSGILLALSFTAKRLAASHPHQVENWFSRGLFPFTSSIQRAISNVLPFSLYEWLLVGLVLYILFRLFVLIRSFFRAKAREELLRFFTQMLFIASLTLFLFQFLWSLNNYRIPLKEQLGLIPEKFSVDDLAATYGVLVEKVNETRSELSLQPDSRSEKEKIRYVLNTAWEGYPPLADKQSLFHAKRVRVKGLFFSRFQTISGYAGVYSFLTGEPNINTEPPLVTLPHTACHEIAHQMGITLEDEANYAGFLACKNHPNELFRYSGYLSALTYTGNALYRQSPEIHAELSALLHATVRADQQEIQAFWNRHLKKSAAEVADRFNEIYLKSNNQEEGLKSYGRFVDLLIAHCLKEGTL